MVDDYLAAMERQLAQYDLAQVTFADLTIGGGTPLYLTVDQLERLFAMAERLTFALKKHERIIETSPRQTTAEKAARLKAHGVTRVSLGVQSFHDQELVTLGRIHRSNEIHQALEVLKQADFSCLNVDLIYGVPGQTPDTVLESLRQALAYAPEEIFLYPLYIKPGTGLYQRQQQQEQSAYQLYCLLRERLLAAGYGQTSMRRFVQGFAETDEPWSGCGFCEHTLSIGCGGRSYIDELHFCTAYGVSPSGCRAILQDYLQKRDHQAITHGYLLSDDERKRRFILKNLLYVQGLPAAAYEAQFGSAPLADYPLLIQWIEAGFAAWDGAGNLRLTQEGLDLSDYLGPQLISQAVKAKMEAWRDA